MIVAERKAKVVISKTDHFGAAMGKLIAAFFGRILEHWQNVPLYVY